jgi:hypothetical protein
VPLVKDMIQSKFLRKEDFDEDRVLTIKGLKLEDMPGDDSQQKWVLYFREEPKGMALNITTIRVLEQAYGSDSDQWVGNKVMVYVDPNVSFGGKIVGGLRLRTPRVKTVQKPVTQIAGSRPPPQRQAPPPQEPNEPEAEQFEPTGTAERAEFDDDIPF